MSIDLSEFEVKKRAPRIQMWKCEGCEIVYVSSGCPVCKNAISVPYIDRRPLLLDIEACNGIIDLIDEASDKLMDMDSDEQLFYSGEYMPFLSRMLEDSELAEKRKAEGSSNYRTTNISAKEIISLLREMRLPPTA